MSTPLSFKDYISYLDDIKSSKTKRRLNKKSPKGRVYGGFGMNLSGQDDMMNGSTTNGGGTATNGGSTGGNGGSTGGTSGGSGGAAVAAESVAVPSVWKKKFMNLVSQEDEEDDVPAEKDTDNENLEDEDLDDLGDEELDDLDFDEEGETEENQDPNKQGIIRKVKKAHLVFKRQDEEGTYEELWIYRSGKKLDKEMEIRRDILAGTDIPQNKTKSQDGSQSYDLWSVGNIQFLHISGLPN